MRHVFASVEVAALPGRSLLEEVRRCLTVTVDSLAAARDRADDSIVRAVALIAASRKKVVFVGVGKSGHVARKLAATFSSTGTPAVFLSASEALHGDVGLLEGGECVVFLSKSGITAELVALVAPIRQRRGYLIGLLGDVRSPLASQMDVVIDASVASEADTLKIAPTASTSVALALGDAMASALMVARGFRTEDFDQLHPARRAGTTTAAQVMRVGEDLPVVALTDKLPAILKTISQKCLGAACVVAPTGQLIGLITDGDLRCYLERHGVVENASAAEIMNARPVTARPTALVRDVLGLMNDRTRPSQFIPVVDDEKNLVGGLWYHDLIR